MNYERGGKALYIQIKEIYRQKILSGQLCMGDKLDSEMEIQRLFGVSRITARQAVLDLEKEGMVCRGRGKGTFVAWQPKNQDLMMDLWDYENQLKSFAHGQVQSKVTLSLEPLGPITSAALGLDGEKLMYCARRTYSDDSRILCFVFSCYPQSFHLETDPCISQQQLQDQLSREAAYAPVRIDETIYCQMPNERLCRALQIGADCPLLVRRKTVYGQESKPVEYVVAFYPGEEYAYKHSISQIQQADSFSKAA